MGSRQSRLGPGDVRATDMEGDNDSEETLSVGMTDALKSNLSKNQRQTASSAVQEELRQAYNDGMRNMKDSIAGKASLLKYEADASWIAKVEYSRSQEKVAIEMLKRELNEKLYRVAGKPTTCLLEEENVRQCISTEKASQCTLLVHTLEKCAKQALQIST